MLNPFQWRTTSPKLSVTPGSSCKQKLRRKTRRPRLDTRSPKLNYWLCKMGGGGGRHGDSPKHSSHHRVTTTEKSELKSNFIVGHKNSLNKITTWGHDCLSTFRSFLVSFIQLNDTFPASLSRQMT